MPIDVEFVRLEATQLSIILRRLGLAGARQIRAEILVRLRQLSSVEKTSMLDFNARLLKGLREPRIYPLGANE